MPVAVDVILKVHVRQQLNSCGNLSGADCSAAAAAAAYGGLLKYHLHAGLYMLCMVQQRDAC